MKLITHHYRGSIIVEGDEPCLAVSVDFVPIYVLGYLERNNLYSVYNFPYSKEESYSSIPNTSSRLSLILTSYATLVQTVTNGLNLLIGKGLIIDKDSGQVLMCLTLKQEELNYDFPLKEMSKSDFSNTDNIDYHKFIMFVSTELVSNSKYSVFYRRLQKIYLNFCFEKGIEMRIISASIIKKNTFANSFKVAFNSITQLQDHLNNDVQHIFMTNEELFRTQDYPLSLVAPPLPVHLEDSFDEIVEDNVMENEDSHETALYWDDLD
jgi:hypothetical protein